MMTAIPAKVAGALRGCFEASPAGPENFRRTYSRHAAEARLRARLLLLIFLIFMAPFLCSFLPSANSGERSVPRLEQGQPQEPSRLNQEMPDHEPNASEYGIALG